MTPYPKSWGNMAQFGPQFQSFGAQNDPGEPNPGAPPSTPGTTPAIGTPNVPYELTPAISRDILTPWQDPTFLQSYGNYGPQYPNQSTQIGAAMYSNIQPQQYMPPWAVQNLPPRLSGPGYLNGGSVGNYGSLFGQRWGNGPREIGNPYPLSAYDPRSPNMNVPPAYQNQTGSMNYNPFTRNQNGNAPYGQTGFPFASSQQADMMSNQGYGQSMGMGGQYSGAQNGYGGGQGYGGGMQSQGYGGYPSQGYGQQGGPSMNAMYGSMGQGGSYSPYGSMGGMQGYQSPYGMNGTNAGGG